MINMRPFLFSRIMGLIPHGNAVNKCRSAKGLCGRVSFVLFDGKCQCRAFWITARILADDKTRLKDDGLTLKDFMNSDLQIKSQDCDLNSQNDEHYIDPADYSGCGKTGRSNRSNP